MKTRYLLIPLTILSLLTTQLAIAQIPVLEWARQMGGASGVIGSSVTVDAFGNVYSTGSFYETIDFDPGPETFHLTSLGNGDVFVQKLDPDGNFLWARQMGGDYNDHGNAIAVDASGNVYTTGTFTGTVDFDPGTDTFNLTATGESGAFVQKLDADGNFQWASHIGGWGAIGSSIALDATGNVYSIGSFLGTVDFDPGADTYNLTAYGWWDGFVQKLDTDGNFVWAKQMGGAEIEFGTSIAVHPSGQVYTTGYFTTIADFDPGAETFNLESFGDYNDVFIQKMDTDGNFLWAKQLGGNSHDKSQAIAVDASGNVYTTGWFQGTTDFDPGASTFNLTSVGGKDAFVHKLNANGDFLWAKQMGNTQAVEGKAITVDASANVYTTGIFKGTLDFNPGDETHNLTSIGNTDGFIQKLDTDGNFLWAEQIGGTANDEVSSISVDASANVYTTGYFSDSVDFDPGLNTLNLTSGGGKDMFIQRLSQCYPSAPPIPHLADMPSLTSKCEVTALDAPAPTATGDCARAVTAYANQTFPITDQSITEIVWTYDDGHGNVTTQNQTVNWTPIDVSTSLTGHTITANHTTGTYQWLDCDNNNAPISGENNQSFTASANGNYAVEITEEGCVDISECVSIISVGLSEIEQEVKVAVYPNPSSDIFNIAFEKPIAHAVLTITDIQGKLISTTKIQNTTKASIELNEAPGVYLLTIKSKDGQKTIQLVVSN